jgi:4-alpha-glucanotransferase
VTRQLHFAWALHNHQPVGNFPLVFEEVYRSAYEPMVAALERHPGVRVTLHYSGPVLDWLTEQHPDALDRLAALVARGQVELLTGGYYEPILPTIPRADRLGQIARMSGALRSRFGVEPCGLWLAERVWEPDLPSTLAEAGVDYTVVDDTHFIMAGLREADLYGYYVTEDGGHPVKVFPIRKSLRESMPWRSVAEVRETLWRMASDEWWPPRIVVMADDGEKFGAWPGTEDLVWRRDWMEEFLRMLEENADWLKTTPLGAFASEYPARGRVYLPAASYTEMMEWALPAQRSAEFGRLRNAVSAAGGSDVHAYMAGASWRGFLAKYPESNHLHKKMLRVHRKVMAALEYADATERATMLDELWMGQCNCPYWHGLFGGLYLADIRGANYLHLLRAEALANAAISRPDGQTSMLTATFTDFDCDGAEELLLEGHLMNVYLDVSEGGAICEWDYLPTGVNLVDTLARRPEAYHARLTQAHAPLLAGGDEAMTVTSGGAGAAAATEVRKREPGLERMLRYDWHRRTSLVDHFLSPQTSFEEYRSARYSDLGDFANQPYVAELTAAGDSGKETLVRLWRDGHLWDGPLSWPARVEKTLTVAADQPRVHVVYTVTNTSTRPLDAASTEAEVSELRLSNAFLATGVTISLDQPAALWRFPVETVSNSEAGLERVYQCSCTLLSWPLALAPGASWQTNLTFTLDRTE